MDEEVNLSRARQAEPSRAVFSRLTRERRRARARRQHFAPGLGGIGGCAIGGSEFRDEVGDDVGKGFLKRHWQCERCNTIQ